MNLRVPPEDSLSPDPATAPDDDARWTASIDFYRQQLERAQLPDGCAPEAFRELARLERIPASSLDYQMTRTYLERVVDFPWHTHSADDFDLAHVRGVLDETLYGLANVKQRIVEHLALGKLKADASPPALLLVGPPGVGKATLAHAMARALGRPLQRLCLAGLQEEALRGQARTHLGAVPGGAVQALLAARVNNPLILLEEVDHLDQDPGITAALGEILDPVQSISFRDRYLNVPCDLSRVQFIATAQSLDAISPRLLERMERIVLVGYGEQEKLRIAKQHLLPRLQAEAGLVGRDSAEAFDVQESALLELIQRYTREAGVLQLQRQLGVLCRKVATGRLTEQEVIPQVGREQLIAWLGPPPYPDSDLRVSLRPGVAAGMVWTPTGGDLAYVEAVALPDETGMRLTGNQHEASQEMAQIALSYVRSQWVELNIDKQALASGIHLHVPAGAPLQNSSSAGITMATALASLYTYLPVRSDVAMTGRLTLTGRVLPVDGINEKILAARRAGVRELILPRQNQHALGGFAEEVPTDLKIHWVGHVTEALRVAIPKLASRLEDMVAMP